MIKQRNYTHCIFNELFVDRNAVEHWGGGGGKGKLAATLDIIYKHPLLSHQHITDSVLFTNLDVFNTSQPVALSTLLYHEENCYTDV